MKQENNKKGSNLIMVPEKDALVSKKQIHQIVGKTPEKHIYERPAKGGGTWKYVTGVYIKKMLNYVFGWNWDFIIKEHGREKNLVWVLGELKIYDQSGSVRIKNQFGRADVKFKTYYDKKLQKKIKTDEMLDFGNDLKAAATDALKKCASEFGFASDIYGENEFKEIQREELADLPEPKSTKVKSKGEAKKVFDAKLKEAK